MISWNEYQEDKFVLENILKKLPSDLQEKINDCTIYPANLKQDFFLKNFSDAFIKSLCKLRRSSFNKK